MATARDNGAPSSALEAIAAHERTLLAQLREAEAEAQGLVDEARADAVRALSDADAATTEAVSRRRREAAQARDRERRELLAAREAALSALRRDAGERVPAIVREVVQLIVPRTGSEGSP